MVRALPDGVRTNRPSGRRLKYDFMWTRGLRCWPRRLMCSALCCEGSPRGGWTGGKRLSHSARSSHIAQIVKTMAGEYGDAVGPWRAYTTILD